MKELQNNPIWSAEVKSISPHIVAEKINKNTKVVLVIGERDDVTPIELSREYYEELKSLGIDVKLIPIPNEGHEILLSDAVQKAIKELLQ